jgi:hypothetical protein
MNSRQQWAHVVSRSKDFCKGIATLDIADPEGDKLDLADTMEGLASLTSGSAQASGMLAFAKMIRRNESGAKAKDRDRREFGLDRLPWDLRDGAVEHAECRGGAFRKTHVNNRQMKREHFMWWLVEGTALDAASTESGRELVSLAQGSGASRRYQENCMYALLDGLARYIAQLDEKALGAIAGGSDLLTLAKACKANTRYAQLRIQWVSEDTYSWAEIEESETLQLEQSVLRKHKTGKILCREKLKRLMRETR